MSEMAKKARAAMKAKAKAMSADPHQKVDSSTWSPPEMLEAGVKTGMRPVSRRQYKSGGKVAGAAAKMNLGKKPRKSGGSAMPPVDRFVNRDMKKANDYRDGEKHIGALKRGGKAYCGGGGAKRNFGGSDEIGDMITSMPAEYDTDAMSQKMQDLAMDSSLRDKSGRIPTPPARPIAIKKETRIVSPYKKGGRIHRDSGGTTTDPTAKQLNAGVPPSLMNFSSSRSPAWQVAKRGGKIEHDDEAADKQLIRKMVKPSSIKHRKDGGQVFSGPNYPGKVPGVVPGGRMARKHGGKTNVHVNINTGKNDMPPMLGGLVPPPPGGMKPMAPPVAPPMAPAGMPPMAGGMPPMAPGGAPPMGPAGAPPMGGMPPKPPMAGMPAPRKSGGRLIKQAHSYKDMEAGAGSAEGRLQKTEIERYKTGRR